MGCEQFGQQACIENDRAADNLARMLDSNDPNQAANAIRQELFDRPPSLSIDLLGRINQYDQKGVGADIRIDPLIRRVNGPYGNNEYIDTGDREVVIDSDLGRDQIAILKGSPMQTYNQYPEPRRLDPLRMITEMFVGGMMNGVFSRWGHQPRRDCWQEQGGRMWYPQPGGRWGHQRFNSWGPSSGYPQSYERGPSLFYQDQRQGWNGRSPHQWQGQNHRFGNGMGQDQWRDQRRWQEQRRWQDSGRGQGQIPEWARRLLEQQQQGRRPPSAHELPHRGPDGMPHRRQDEPPNRRQEELPHRRQDQLPNRNDRTHPNLIQPDRRPPDQTPPGHRFMPPGQGRQNDGQPPFRRGDIPRPHIPEQNQQPNWRNGGGRNEVPRRDVPAVPPRVVPPPARVVPPPQQHHQPGDRRRQR